ncbi:MAG TPA: hypothetical protein VHV78_11510, partial [Gemmatimonadaceae bacterium]|nr:hypothetical protein [Gemmatimonadaceae bacterium]
MISRREFFDRSGRLALGLGAIRMTDGVLPSCDSAGLLAGSSSESGASALQGRELTLGNEAISATWTIVDASVRWTKLANRLRNADLPTPSELFTLIIGGAGGGGGGGAPPQPMPASAFRIVGDPRVERVGGDSNASRLAERLPGHTVAATLRDPDGRLEVAWRGVLRDGSSYVRQEFSIRALGADVPLREIALLDFNSPNTWASGTVRGSPIVVGGDAYYAFEHPLANNAIDGDRVRCRMSRTLPLRSGTTLEVSSVVGI